MFLKQLKLSAFRNIGQETLFFHPKFNLFIGANAQGKTNLLEAIYLLAFGRSFRNADYRGLIGLGEAEAWVRAKLETDSGEEERRAHLRQERKENFKNGKRTTPNQFKSMPLVLFAPESIHLLKERPSARREYVDGLLTKLSQRYGGHLKKYKKALSQRNRLLKEDGRSLEEKRKQILLWEGPLIEHGTILIHERRHWLLRFNEMISLHYNQIAGTDEKRAGFSYQLDCEPEAFRDRFEKRQKEELERGITLVGPHRDDIVACLNGGWMKSFGSQGEMRTFTLAMKLSEIELFEEGMRRSPILLLDDFLSELDENRSHFFLEYLKSFQGQVFLTATSLSFFPKGALQHNAVWGVKAGRFSMLRRA